ncbi:25453_t:CDS:2, partial [Gigaspora margarita]
LQNKKVMITEVLELYYDSRVPNKDGVKDTTREKRELKEKKPVKLGPNIALHKSRSENKTIGTLTNKNEEEKMDHIDATNKPVIKKAKHEAYEPYQDFAEINLDDKVNDLKIGTEREETFDTSNIPESEGLILNLIKNSPEVTLAEALIYYQRSNDDNEDGETIFDTESKGNAPGEEDYRKFVEIEKAVATKLGKEKKKEKELEDAPTRPGDNRNNETKKKIKKRQLGTTIGVTKD